MTTIETTPAQARRIEYLLKKSMAKQLAAIQSARHTSASGGNLATAENYVEDARALRDVIEARDGREGYVPLVDMIADTTYVSDRVRDAAGLNRSDDVRTVLEKIQSVGNPHIPPRTLTEHKTVPGCSGPGGDA